ncbi:MAG: organic solvent ABC transporter permease [Bdellovibrio sp.]|nr:MAG: organic solvent ABC transporter permease [Bdellovibrio sp.]
MDSYQGVTQFIQLVVDSLAEGFRPPLRIRETVQQLYFIAVQSLPIILFCVCFAAMVTILESSFHMKLVIQNDSMVPGFAAMLILRELGAVVTALLVTSRVGAGIAAEVGTMKITEQIDALRMLGIRPIHYIVVPRLIASVIGLAILTIIANLVCLFVAFLVSEIYLGFTSGLFITGLVRFIHFQDLVFSIIKGACFGFVIPLVSCHFGFLCASGAEGVGLATTRSVVASSVIIIILDFVLSFVFSFFS